MQSFHTDKPKVLANEAISSAVQQVPRKSYFQEINADKPLEDWIEKYNQKRSYALAIYIAKQYYFDNDYKQAGVWAKRANQLDRNQEEAWLLYAKSVYALNNKEKAVRILKIYLQYKESSKAEFLLSEWSN
jgi:thioredoxin-like negative regulator of GroEL